MFEYDLSGYKGDTTKPIVIDDYFQRSSVDAAGGVTDVMIAYNNTQKKIIPVIIEDA